MWFQALDRGENLTILADKTETLRSQVSRPRLDTIVLNHMLSRAEGFPNFQAQDFRKQGTQVRRKMWYHNMKIKLVVLGILLFLVLVIWLSVCHGFNCTN